MKPLGELAVLVIGCLLFSGQSGYCATSFRLEHSYQLPTIHGRIQELRFVAVDRNGTTGLLIRDSLDVTLFSLSGDSAIASIPLDTMTFWKLAFADVNRDSIPDLVIGSLASRPNSFPATIAILRLYDGATGYQWTSSDSFLTSVSGPQGPLGVAAGLLDAADLDGDGYNELMVSIDSTYDNMDMSGDIIWSESAHSFGYYSFPSTRAWRNGSFLTRLDTLRLPGGELIAFPTLYWYYNLKAGHGGLDNYQSFQSPVHLHFNGTIGVSLGHNNVESCNNDVSNGNVFTLLAQGPILGDSLRPNMLIAYHKSFHSYPVCPAIDSDSLILFALAGADSVARVWEVAPSRDLLISTFFFHPQRSGKLLAQRNGQLLVLDASSLAVSDSLGPVPSGTGGWMYPAGDGIPRFVVTNGSTLTEYLLSDSTATDSNNDPSDLPLAFSLSPNYPNPFNPSTEIRYSIPRASQVSIAVYNVLGQRVTGLVDLHQKAGNYRITWDGTDSRGKSVASGIYFYRMKADQFVQSHKMILLK